MGCVFSKRAVKMPPSTTVKRRSGVVVPMPTPPPPLTTICGQLLTRKSIRASVPRESL
jgi:hypothetical protein